MTTATVRQTTDGIDVDDIHRVEYDESSIAFDEIPRFDLEVENESGVNAHKLFVGKEVTIKRSAATAFPGVVETIEPERSATRAPTISIRGVHKGYHLMRRALCTSYDFDEDGDPSTTRDGVTVNPWDYFIFRNPGGTLDVYGNTQPVDGVTVDGVVKCLLGSKFIHQIDFQDNTSFLATDVYATTNTLQVYRDGPSGDLRPALQRTRSSGEGFNDNPSGERIESIPYYNADRNVSKMGAITTIAVTLVGTRNGTDDPVIEVCRDAVDANNDNNTTRTYTSVTLTHTANYNGITGLSAWTGTATVSSDGASVTNALGFRIRITGTDGSAATTKLYYAKFDCDLVTNDTGLTTGTIDAYSNPVIDGLGEDADGNSLSLTNNGKDWVQTNLLGMTRLEAMEVVRESTESTTATNPSPHWDAWIDADLALHFKERRGAEISKTYSFAEENINVIKHQYDGVEVAYQTIAYGPGSGTAQTRIVSKTEFSAGGLYDSDRDPTTGSATSELANIARTSKFVDSNEKSVVQLLRKARAHHKLHRAPIETFDVDLVAEHIPYFNVGDSITLNDVPTRSNASTRVVSIRRSFTGGNRERVKVRLNEPPFNAARINSATAQQADVITLRGVPEPSTSGLSGSGTYFSNDGTDNILGVYSFGIQDGANIDRVFLKVNQLPWQATSKAADFSAATTDNEGAHTHGMDHTHSVPGSSHSHTVPGSSHSHSVTVATTDKDLVPGHQIQGIPVVSTNFNTTGWTTVGSFTLTGSQIFDLDYAAVYLFTWNNENADHSFNYRVRVSQAFVSDVYGAGGSGGTTGRSSSNGVTVDSVIMGIGVDAFDMEQLSSASSGTFFLEVQSASGANFTDDAGGYWVFTERHDHEVSGQTATATTPSQVTSNATTPSSVTSGSSSLTTTQAGSAHNHTISVTDVPLLFGIYQFDGDGGDGTGDPVYGKNCKLSVDPELTNGRPTTAQFNDKAVNVVFGVGGNTPQSIEVDVTGYMDTDANGVIKSGEHRVWFQSSPDTTHATVALRNAKGLAVASVTPIIKSKEKSQ